MAENMTLLRWTATEFRRGVPGQSPPWFRFHSAVWEKTASESCWRLRGGGWPTGGRIWQGDPPGYATMAEAARGWADHTMARTAKLKDELEGRYAKIREARSVALYLEVRELGAADPGDFGGTPDAR